MHFCSNCHNMYYLKIRDAEEGANSLIYYCRNCGNEDTTLTSENICVSETQLRRSEQKYTHMVNEYTKYDPTLPRINSIKCPNQDCISNTKLGGAKPKATAATAAEDTKKKPVLKVKTTKKALAQAEQAQQIQAQQIQAQQIQAQQIEAQEQLVEQQAQAALTEAEQVKAAAEQLIEGKEEKGEKEEGQKGESMREVIYIRYDDINMKYVYLCVHCDTTWKTDNRI